MASVRACGHWLSLYGSAYLRDLKSTRRTVGQACPPGGLIGMLPVEHNDPINARILAISEDKIEGFVGEPFREIAEYSGVEVDVVMARIAAMLRAGTIRRVRQTLLATNLAEGALVAWRVPEDKIDTAFDWMFQRDPFSGHVVLRSTDTVSAGSDYKLWTTLKVPQGFSLQAHCELLAKKVGAERFRLMPAKGIFTLGVGHVRRRTIEPGSKAHQPAKMIPVQIAALNEREWKVLLALKREFTPEEIKRSPWVARAEEAGVSLGEFFRVAEELSARKIIGRFSTFLEHVKPSAGGVRVTRFNALFHWAVLAGREIEAGGEVGRHHILTHCYWREAGPEFKNVNIMAVAHGTDKQLLLDHKSAIDRHLNASGIPVSYTNVFWGGRSEIKPSEVSPNVYHEWWAKQSKS
jgi:AsnC-like ligand binding domain